MQSKSLIPFLHFHRRLGPSPGLQSLGLGLSVVFPLTLHVAARSERSSGPAIAAVSTVGYMGFLIDPPPIGLLAVATGLRVALGRRRCLCRRRRALGQSESFKWTDDRMISDPIRSRNSPPRSRAPIRVGASRLGRGTDG